MADPNAVAASVVSSEPSAVADGKLTAADVFNMVNEVTTSNDGSLDFTDPFQQEDPFELIHRDEENENSNQQQQTTQQNPPPANTNPPNPATTVDPNAAKPAEDTTQTQQQNNNQPTPEQIKAQQEAFAKQNQNFLEALTKHYGFELPEDSSLPPEVTKFVPEYATKIHLSVVQQMTQQFAQNIDQIVESRIEQYKQKTEVVNEFQQQFPQINIKDPSVKQTMAGIIQGIDNSGKKFASNAERIKMIGATTCLVLGLDPTPKGNNVTSPQVNSQGQNNRPAQVVQPSPVTPIRANGGAANNSAPNDANKKSDIDSMFDLLSPIMRPR